MATSKRRIQELSGVAASGIVCHHCVTGASDEAIGSYAEQRIVPTMPYVCQDNHTLNSTVLVVGTSLVRGGGSRASKLQA
jgi:hypothetical protein